MKTVAVLLLTCLCVLPAGAKYSGGSGTAQDPYQIATAVDLIALGEAPEDYDKCFILTADIDLDPNLPGRKVFERAVIAPDTNPSTLHYEGAAFTGVFDGRGHTITNLRIVGRQYLGLFGWIDSRSQVRRLDLEAVEISGIGFHIGSLVGRSTYGSIALCSSSGFVGGDSDVGGLVGCNEYGCIAASHSCGSAWGTGWGVGGLVGINYGSIVMSYSIGSVEGTGSGAGGLVGDNEGSIMTSCADGSVSGKYYIGGLAGDNEGRITTSYSSGSASGECHYVGGLVGENQGTVTMSYSCGSVRGAFKVGGLVGTAGFGSVVNQSFWDIETSGWTTSDGGTGKTTSQMQTAATFLDTGWDFVDETTDGTEGMWYIVEGEDYPRLVWEYKASCPEPNDGALDVPPPVILSWIAGSRTLASDIYFGEEEAAVADATPESDGTYLGRRSAGITTYDLGVLDPGKTYYWRIDGLNQTESASPWKGKVWWFITAQRRAIRH